MNDDDSLKRKREILDYWTMVEFFSPYFFDQVWDMEKQCQRVFVDELSIMPWEHAKPLAEDDPTNSFSKGYHLYLGIFSVEETADRARHVFCERPSDWQTLDWKQCGAANTLSCFARLTVTKFGVPLLGTLTLSTLPWAHGCLLNDEAEFLTMEFYWKSVQRLLVDLKRNFVSTLPQKLIRFPNESAGIVDHSALCRLGQILFHWAGFAPKYYPIAMIEPLPHEDRKIAWDPTILSEKDVPILNSFYIQDLERAALSLGTQKDTVLDDYISRNCDSRIFLVEEKGKEKIVEANLPMYYPKARWPAPDSNHQSLMQQFAVNQARRSLVEGGLFSVNGPPGTGKTSLLREMIAENIVSRAHALAQFRNSKDTFTGTRAISFGDGEPVYVSEIDPSLLGYEMLVVSSNNTAVQNISHELPLREQIADTYQDISYLEPVAQKLFRDEEDHVWGLISAALGNRENCRRFVNRVFIERDHDQPGLRIWDWVEEYDGLSFGEAREQFLSLWEENEDLREELDWLSYLHEGIRDGDWEAERERLEKELENAEESVAKLREQLEALCKEETKAQELLDLLTNRSQLWEKERPGILDRISKSEQWNNWSRQFKEYNRQQISALEKLHDLKKKLSEIEMLLLESKKLIEDKQIDLLEWTFHVEFSKATYEDLKDQFSSLSLPEGIDEIEDEKVQKQAYYECEKMNQNRSQLFVAAMKLHEAWLAETLRPKGGFRGNLLAISSLLQGKTPSTAEDTCFVWQNVFLFIPVLSSTFASIGRLFRYLEPGTLGWVFIDEAGQALPQAAVGAIWRAKRVVSIGDPFQIEPISTIPPEVIDGIAKHRMKDQQLTWAPSFISVQTLMDAATQHVTKREIGENTYILGAPLRVHRRCIEPMFSIANEIAYDNSMILATQEVAGCPLPKSCWYDMTGTAIDKQYVPNQGKELLKCLHHAFSVMEVPDIYIISPFREVVSQIKNLITRDSGLKKSFGAKYPSVPLNIWVQKSIGTIHTFQGKQAAAVFLVLGCDSTTLGSIDWAARKPNLLNVAVTRARLRFYMIGDYDLWRRWPYFEVAARELQKQPPMKQNPNELQMVLSEG